MVGRERRGGRQRRAGAVENTVQPGLTLDAAGAILEDSERARPPRFSPDPAKHRRHEERSVGRGMPSGRGPSRRTRPSLTGDQQPVNKLAQKQTTRADPRRTGSRSRTSPSRRSLHWRGLLQPLPQRAYPSCRRTPSLQSPRRTHGRRRLPALNRHAQSRRPGGHPRSRCTVGRRPSSVTPVHTSSPVAL